MSEIENKLLHKPSLETVSKDKDGRMVLSDGTIIERLKSSDIDRIASMFKQTKSEEEMAVIYEYRVPKVALEMSVFPLLAKEATEIFMSDMRRGK